MNKLQNVTIVIAVYSVDYTAGLLSLKLCSILQNCIGNYLGTEHFSAITQTREELITLIGELHCLPPGWGVTRFFCEFFYCEFRKTMQNNVE